MLWSDQNWYDYILLIMQFLHGRFFKDFPHRVNKSIILIGTYFSGGFLIWRISCCNSLIVECKLANSWLIPKVEDCSTRKANLWTNRSPDAPTRHPAPRAAHITHFVRNCCSNMDDISLFSSFYLNHCCNFSWIKIKWYSLLCKKDLLFWHHRFVNFWHLR